MEQSKKAKLSHTAESVDRKLNVSFNFGNWGITDLFASVMNVVNKIIFSDAFRQTMISLMPEEYPFDEGKFDNMLETAQFIIQPNLQTLSISAYTSTDIKPDANGCFCINVNAQLLVNCAMQGTASDHIVLFMVTKVVQQLGHIFNQQCCTFFVEKPNRSMPVKNIIEAVKERLPSEKVQTSMMYVLYDDFGELLEVTLFGGFLESNTTSENYMQIDRVISYPSKDTMFGNVVDCTASLSNFRSGNFKLVVDDEYESESDPTGKGITVDLPGIRLCAPGVCESHFKLKLPPGVRL